MGRGESRSVGVDHRIDVQRFIDHSSPTRRWCTTNAFVPSSTKSAPSSAATTTSRLSRNSANNAASVMLPVAIPPTIDEASRQGGVGRPGSPAILRHYHAAAAVGELRDPGVRCRGRRPGEPLCARRHVQPPPGSPSEPSGQSERRRGTSRRAERDHAATASGQRPELQGGKDVLTLEIRVVVEHLVDRHAGRQQLQQALDRVRADHALSRRPWQDAGSDVMRCNLTRTRRYRGRRRARSELSSEQRRPRQQRRRGAPAARRLPAVTDADWEATLTVDFLAAVAGCG